MCKIIELQSENYLLKQQISKLRGIINSSQKKITVYQEVIDKSFALMSKLTKEQVE